MTDAAELAAQGRRALPGCRSSESSSIGSSANPSPAFLTPTNELPSFQSQKSLLSYSSSEDAGGLPTNGTPNGHGHSNVQRPDFAGASSVAIDSHSGLHIVLPTSASHATVPASLTSLRHCVVDLSIPTASGKPFAGLAVKNVNHSLLVCGQVNGAAHITGVRQSVIVVLCHQFRMHDCHDVDVYLYCSSKPVIERCENIRFGEIPQAYVSCFFFPRLL